MNTMTEVGMNDHVNDESDNASDECTSCITMQGIGFGLFAITVGVFFVAIGADLASGGRLSNMIEGLA